MKYTTTVQGQAFDIEWDALPEASQQAIIAYGFQRFVNDRANTLGKDAPAADKVAQARAVLDMLKAGWVGRMPSAGKVESVQSILAGLVLAVAKAVAKQKGKKWADLNAATQSKIRDAIIAQKGDELTKQAEAELAARRDAVGVDIEL